MYGADESYLEATITLVDDLLKDLTPVAFTWREPSYSEVLSASGGASTPQCSSDKRASCRSLLHRRLQTLGTEEEVGWNMYDLDTSNLEGLESFKSGDHASRELQAIEKGISPEAVGEQSGEDSTSDPAKVDQGCGVQKVSFQSEGL